VRHTGHARKINTYRTTLKGKHDIYRFRSRYEYNIKIDLREIRREAVGCIHLAQNQSQRRALVNMIDNLQVSYNCKNRF
jgi:hypothetical protein